MLRTMWCRNAFACTSTTTSSPSRRTEIACRLRRAWVAWHCTLRKAEKSCSPTAPARWRAWHRHPAACVPSPGTAAPVPDARCGSGGDSDSAAHGGKRALKSSATGTHQRTAMVGGRLAVIPRIQPRASRRASVSKWTTWHWPCTPASVRPAHTGVDARIGDPGQGVLQRGLQAAIGDLRAGRAQALPAGKPAAVVLDPQRQAHAIRGATSAELTQHAAASSRRRDRRRP